MFRIICAAAFFIVASALIPYEDIETELFHGRSVESSVREALEKAKDIDNEIIKKGGAALEMIPYIGSIGSFVSDSVKAFDDNVWKDTLINVVSDQIVRTSMKTQVDGIRATIRTVSQNINRLKNVDDRTKSDLCTGIETELSRTINLYLDAETIRMYPQFAYVPLSVLASIVFVFHPILKTYAPDLAQTSMLSCRLETILKEYRTLVVVERFKYIKAFDSRDNPWTSPSDTNPEDKARANLISTPYNPLGYNNDAKKNGIRCVSKGCYIKRNDRVGCLRDSITNEEYLVVNTVGWQEWRNCYSDYIDFLRHKIEQVFDKSISLVSSVCTDQMKNRRRPNGYGWWSIVIYGGRAQSKSLHLASPYLKLFIDGKQVLRTPTHHYAVIFDCYYAYTTMHMQKSANIVIELWDYYRILADERLLSRNIYIQDGDTFGRIGDENNYVKWRAIWRNEYEDDL